MNLKYRAILKDPGNTTLERPVQIFSATRPPIDEWAEKVLNIAIFAAAYVEVFEVVETKIDIIRKNGTKIEAR
jgi:hypothetical protein